MHYIVYDSLVWRGNKERQAKPTDIRKSNSQKYCSLDIIS